jgi:hypothetical protein
MNDEPVEHTNPACDETVLADSLWNRAVKFAGPGAQDHTHAGARMIAHALALSIIHAAAIIGAAIDEGKSYR